MDPSNLNEMLERLEKGAMHTTNGTYVRLDEVRRLIEEKQATETPPDPEADPPPKTIEQARAGAKEYLEEQGMASSNLLPGRSVPATEAQPPSRA